jgi:hypothetical protein
MAYLGWRPAGFAFRAAVEVRREVGVAKGYASSLRRDGDTPMKACRGVSGVFGSP